MVWREGTPHPVLQKEMSVGEVVLVDDNFTKESGLKRVLVWVDVQETPDINLIIEEAK